MSCPARSTQRHIAREQPVREVQIFYPNDPRTGTVVPVIGEVHLGDERYLIILQKDGTRAHVPLWMTLPAAANLPIHTPPRISMQALVTLRLELDGVLSSLAGTTAQPGDVDEAR